MFVLAKTHEAAITRLKIVEKMAEHNRDLDAERVALITELRSTEIALRERISALEAWHGEQKKIIDAQQTRLTELENEMSKRVIEKDNAILALGTTRTANILVGYALKASQTDARFSVSEPRRGVTRVTLAAEFKSPHDGEWWFQQLVLDVHQFGIEIKEQYRPNFGRPNGRLSAVEVEKLLLEAALDGWGDCMMCVMCTREVAETAAYSRE